MTRVCALSDLHGSLINIDKCDLVLVCGDSVSLRMQRYEESTEQWYLEIFRPWAEALPCDKVLWIAGNHDNMQGRADSYRRLFPRSEKVTYLEDEGYEFRGLKIWGSPWCKKFGTWHFMESSEVLKEKYSLIPEGLDILITHDVPYGCSDVLLDKTCPWWTPRHIGNQPLAEAVKNKKPRYHFSGHLHSTNRELIDWHGVQHANVSILGESYCVEAGPLYVDL